MIYFILILATLLRLVSLKQSFWLDEATSALVVRDLSLTEIFTKFLPGDFHPPLYYVFLKGWASVFGYSEVALRSLSVVFGVLTVYLVYRIAKELFANEKTALLAALLLAVSGLHIYYSQEARMYVLQSFFVAASVYYFTKIYFSKARLAEWALFALTLPLIFLTDYLPILILPALWAFALVFRKQRDWIIKFFLAHIPLLGAFLIWQKHFMAQLGGGLSVESLNAAWWGILGPTNPKNVLLVYIKFIFGRISTHDKTLYGLIAGSIGLVFAFVLLRPILVGKIKPVAKYLFVWFWFLVPIVVTIIVGLTVPVLSYFRLLFVLPAFYILLARGLAVAKGKALLVIVCGATLLSALVYLLGPEFHREDWRSFAKTVEEDSLEPSRVVFPSFNNHEGYVVYGGSEKVSGNLVLLSNYQTVWFVRYLLELYPEGDNIRRFAEEVGFTNEGVYDFNGIVVWKYQRVPN